MPYAHARAEEIARDTVAENVAGTGLDELVCFGK
jgi:hypothetical protein